MGILECKMEKAIAVRISMGYGGMSTRNMLAPFIRFCESRYPEAENITKDMVDSWLKEHKYTINTQMTFIATLRILCRYIQFYGEGKMAKEKDGSIPHLHSHMFRRTRAMLLYQGGMPLPLVAEWLGHSQLETTTIYAKATIEMKKAARDKVAENQKSVFHDKEKFKYADDEETLRKLMGL